MLIKKDKNRRKIQLLTQVYNLAKVHGKVNTLIIQRKLKIGYGTAWRLIDALVLLDILDRKKEPCGCSYSIITNTPTKQKLNKKQEQLIKNNAEKLGAIYGPLYSLIHFNQINKRYEKAVMLAIRVYLNNFVVDTRETILNCIRFSKAHNLPRSTFYALSEFKPQALVQKEAIDDYPGLIGRASSIVKCEPLIENLISHLLSNVLIFDSIESASEAAKRTNYQYKIITIDGDIIHVGGAYSFGNRKSQE